MADMIKKQYLGGEKLKKKMLKPSEKFKFNFDWEAGDDTSKDLNPLYNNTHEAQLLFGRGLRAGVDRREQKKVPTNWLCACLASHMAFSLRLQHQYIVTSGAMWFVLCCQEQSAILHAHHVQPKCSVPVLHVSLHVSCLC